MDKLSTGYANPIDPATLVLVDAVLASAIIAAGGNPSLLLPALRDDALACWDRSCDENFVLDLYSLVWALRKDVRFKDVLRATAPLAPSFPAKVSTVNEKVTPRWLAQRARSFLKGNRIARGWQMLSAKLQISRSTRCDTAPKIPETPSVRMSGPSIGPARCHYNTRINVHCENGRLVDALGSDYGRCPECL